MDLHHLRYLIALAEHQSFRKAADALHLTQPALSRSLQALEQDLGVMLLDRVGKRSTLTAYGEQVVQSARRILSETAELRRGVALMKQGDLGTIRIGFGPTAAAILMTPFLSQMAARHPKVQVNVARGSVALLTQALRSEAVDIIAVDLRALRSRRTCRSIRCRPCAAASCAGPAIPCSTSPPSRFPCCASSRSCRHP